MKATDIRDENWDEIRDRLRGPRETVWAYLRGAGPATTSTVAARTGIPLLTVRPRLSELVAMGFAECVGRDGREGVYQAVKIEAARLRFEEETREAQMNLQLKEETL